MSAQDTPKAVEDNSDDERPLEELLLADGISLPAEELAVALYMSDMPDRLPKGDTWTLEQFDKWIDDGIETLDGIAQVWYAAYRSQQAAKAGDWMAYHLFWDDSRREKTARQAAAQITSSDLYYYKPKMVTVVIASCDSGHEWTIDLDARDVRFAARLGVVLR